MWATMLQCHRRQHVIIKSLSSSCKLEMPLDSEPQRKAAVLLTVELGKLRSNLRNWVASHRAYLRSLNLWLCRCMKPLRKRKSSRKQNASVSLTECAVTPMFATCEIWIKLLGGVPTEDFEKAIDGLVADISSHLPRPRHLDQSLEETLNGGKEEEVPRDDVATDLQSSLAAFGREASVLPGDFSAEMP